MSYLSPATDPFVGFGVTTAAANIPEVNAATAKINALITGGPVETYAPLIPVSSIPIAYSPTEFSTIVGGATAIPFQKIRGPLAAPVPADNPQVVGVPETSFPIRGTLQVYTDENGTPQPITPATGNVIVAMPQLDGLGNVLTLYNVPATVINSGNPVVFNSSEFPAGSIGTEGLDGAGYVALASSVTLTSGAVTLEMSYATISEVA